MRQDEGRGFNKNFFNVSSDDRQYILPRKLKICHNRKQLKRGMGKFKTEVLKILRTLHKSLAILA